MTWYEEFFGAIDAMDTDQVSEMLTEGTTFRLGNGEEVVGRDLVVAGTKEFLRTLSGLKHTVVNVLEEGDLATIEGIVEYTRLDGSTVEIRSATMIERRDGLIAAQRVYIDLAPLLAGPAAASPPAAASN